MTIALSHGGTTMYSSPSRSDELWVGTRKGIAVLERDSDGNGWRVARHMLADKHISAIHQEPESGMFFAGAFHDGLHVSGDHGATWEARETGLTERDVYSIASRRTSGGTRLYAGTEPAHLFCSDDLGGHWTELPALRSVPSLPDWSFPAPPHIAHAKHLNFDPHDPDTLYVCVEVGGLMKSTDRGETFEELHGIYEDAHRLVIHPEDSDRMYVVTGRGLYVSLDGGKNFEEWISRPSEIGSYPDGCVLHPQKPELMFISSAEHSPGAWRKTHFAGARISRSTDGGRTWEILRNGLPDRLQASIEALCLEAAGDTVSVFAATTAGDIYHSDDAGDSWSIIASGLAPISKDAHYKDLQAA